MVARNKVRRCYDERGMPCGIRRPHQPTLTRGMPTKRRRCGIDAAIYYDKRVGVVVTPVVKRASKRHFAVM